MSNIIRWFNNLRLSNKFNALLGIVAFLALLTIFLLGGNSNSRLTKQLGELRLDQEITLVQEHLLQMQQEQHRTAVLFSNTPGLVALVESNNEAGLRALAVTTIPTLGIDDFDIIDIEGNHLIDAEEELSDDEGAEKQLIKQALIGVQRTTILQEEVDGKPRLLLVSVHPLKYRSGVVVGAILIAREVDETFLNELNFSRRGIELSLIYNDQVISESLALDVAGKPIANNTDFPLKPELIATALSGEVSNNPVPMYDADGALYSETYLPFKGLGDRNPTAVLRIAVDNDIISDYRREQGLTFGIVMPVIAGVLVLMAGAFVRTTVTQRVIGLEKAATEIAQGNFSERVQISGRDEIGQVAQAFNQMAEGIEQRQRELNEINQTLEKRVAERTIELKKARDEALASQRIALENSRLKSEFLSTMSHELRTPLNAIEGFTSIMLGGMGIELSPRAEDMTKRISSNSKRLLNLINDFLDLSRIESGRLELVQEPISPAELAQKWQKEVSVLAENKGIEFGIDIDPALPEMLYGDEDALSKIAINLLGNAFKFTRQGYVSLAIGLEEDTWTISVSDTGIGIPLHAREYIFDEFRQVDGSSKREFGGTGLGLALVQKLSRAMGGNVSLQSEVGSGSTFTVSLPLITHLETKVTTEEGITA